MSGPNQILAKNFVAAAAVAMYRIVKFGDADHKVLQAAAAGDVGIGVSADIAAAEGERLDVHLIGLADVEYGDTVARGDLLTADADGKAVPAVLAAGSIVRVIGQAMVAGVDGDIGVVHIQPVATVGALGMGAPSFVIGAETGGNTRNVAIQLKDAAGQDLAYRGAVRAYLSADANGDAVIVTAPSGGVAIGADGLALPIIAGKFFEFVSEADGDIDINIVEAGAYSAYLIVILPNGKLAASAEIAFAG